MIDFEKIYSIYFKEVYYFLLQLSKNEYIAEEIASETFFKALKNLKDYKGDSSIRTYLFQIAKHTYFSYYKKSKREINTDDITVFEEKIDSLEKDLIDRERDLDVSEAVNELKEPYRTIVTLRIWEEMSFKQIAKIYDKSDNWACVTFHRRFISSKTCTKLLSNVCNDYRCDSFSSSIYFKT